MKRVILKFHKNANIDLCCRKVPMLVEMYEESMGEKVDSIKLAFQENGTVIMYDKGYKDAVACTYGKASL